MLIFIGSKILDKKKGEWSGFVPEWLFVFENYIAGLHYS